MSEGPDGSLHTRHITRKRSRFGLRNDKRVVGGKAAIVMDTIHLAVGSSEILYTRVV